ncbi:hypothetical protein Tco_1546626 [Tanacetum coccineum]
MRGIVIRNKASWECLSGMEKLKKKFNLSTRKYDNDLEIVMFDATVSASYLESWNARQCQPVLATKGLTQLIWIAMQKVLSMVMENFAGLSLLASRDDYSYCFVTWADLNIFVNNQNVYILLANSEFGCGLQACYQIQYYKLELKLNHVEDCSCKNKATISIQTFVLLVGVGCCDLGLQTQLTTTCDFVVEEEEEASKPVIPKDLVIRIGSLKTEKEMWEAIKTRNLGAARVNEARLQTIITEFENLKMLDNDTIDEYAAKLLGIAFKSATLREVMSEHKLVKTFLTSLPRRFVHIVAADVSRDY